jgi:hypothetical protein
MDNRLDDRGLRNHLRNKTVIPNSLLNAEANFLSRILRLALAKHSQLEPKPVPGILLDEQIAYDIPFDIRQPVMSPLELEGKTLMVHP